MIGEYLQVSRGLERLLQLHMEDCTVKPETTRIGRGRKISSLAMVAYQGIRKIIP